MQAAERNELEKERDGFVETGDNSRQKIELQENALQQAAEKLAGSSAYRFGDP